MESLDKAMDILIVDDFATMRRIIRNLLRDLGFKNTKEADDGATAMPMLLAGNYKLLITDLHMPKIGGIELVKSLRQEKKLTKLSVLLVVPDTKRKILVDAAMVGIDSFIVKPFTEVVLQEKIEKIFSRIMSDGIDI